MTLDPPKFPSSCVRKACKTLQLVTAVIKHSPSSSSCNGIRAPCSWNAIFFLSSPTQTHPHCFHGAVWLPGPSDCGSCRDLEDTELKGISGGRILPAWSAPGSSQLPGSSASPRLPTQPTTGREKLLLFLLAVTSPPSHACTPASPLQAKQLQFIWSFLISHIFPLPPTILFALFSTKNLSQKFRADLPTAKRSRQLLALFPGYLPVERWGLPTFHLKTMQSLPHIQLATASHPIFYQTLFLEWEVGHLFLSKLSKPGRVNTPGFLPSASKKLFCCRIFLGPEGWELRGSSLPSRTGSAAFVPFQPPGSSHLPQLPTALCLLWPRYTLWGVLPLCHGYKMINQLIAVNLFTEGSKKPV